MALTTAIGTGVFAAIVAPWLMNGREDMFGGMLTGEIVHIPVGYGHEIHWSWLVFCVVTLFTWAALAVTQER